MKIKTTILLFVLFFTFQNINAQAWSSVGTGLINGTTGNVNALAEYEGDLYVAGQFGSAGSNVALSIAKWDGVNWSSVNIGLTNGSSIASVNALQVYKNELYVGGSFITAGGNLAMSIAKWNGSNWSSVGSVSSLGIVNMEINAMTVHNGELYVGGAISNMFGQQIGVIKWNGNNWSKVSLGIGGGTVNALCSYNGTLYAGGNFPLIGGLVSGIAKWNGSSWTSVGSGINPPVYALKVYNNELYAGTSIAALSTNALKKWNGSSWSSVASGILGEVRTMHVANNELYVGGSFFSFTGSPGNNIAKWNGSSWSAIGAGLDGAVYAITDYKNELYAGGVFLTSATTNNVNFIARWNNLVGVEEEQIQDKINVFPNPSNGIINIESKNDIIECVKVYSVLGELVYSSEKNNIQNMSVDMSDFKNGMYLINITTNNGITDKRVIIAK